MKPKVLLIDNFDSFTFNLMHYLEALDTQVEVVRNDELSRLSINDYTKVLISPGPGIPNEAGQLMSFLKNNYALIPILGVCLGQQALGELFGATLSKLPEVQHGKQKEIKHFGNDSIYTNINEKFKVGLYYSYQVMNLPNSIIPTAVDDNNVVMSFKHESLPIKAVQYHPESIMTEFGLQILKNWIEK